MGLIKSPLGVITQSVGSLTFSTWKGKNVVKSKVPDNNLSKSSGQVKQRNEFSVLAKLSGRLGRAIRVGFRLLANGMTEQNVFMTRNKSALTIDPQTGVISGWQKLIISAGKLDQSPSVVASLDGPSDLVRIQWDGTISGSSMNDRDEAFGAVVNTKTGEGWVANGNAQRQDQILPIDVPGINAANKADYRAYLFFKSFNSSDVSNTSTDVIR